MICCCTSSVKREYLLVVNASNTDKDFEWVKSHADTWDVTVTSESSFTAQIAIQGPRALEILQPLVDLELAPMGYYWFGMGRFKACRCCSRARATPARTVSRSTVTPSTRPRSGTR